ANSTKAALLAGIQGAALPLPHAQPAPVPIRVLASDVVAPGGNQQALTLQIVNDGPRPLPLARAELRYWWDRAPPPTTPVTATSTPATTPVAATSTPATPPVTATPTPPAGPLASAGGEQR